MAVLQKMTCNLRHPMGLRHPTADLFLLYTMLTFCSTQKDTELTFLIHHKVVLSEYTERYESRAFFQRRLECFLQADMTADFLNT